MECSRFKFRVWRRTVNNYDPDRFKLTQDGRLNIGGLVVVDPENYTIEQCTGLTDKNGRWIYEGDVVRDDKGIKSVVIWLHGGFYLEYKDGGLGDLASFSIDLEIIGNIHEDQFRDLAEKVEDDNND